jgi:hypothetical protein
MTATGKTSARGRRQFLRGVGASGLAAAAVVFGRQQAALASACTGNHLCCNLALPYAPGRYCYTGHYYSWVCSCSKNGFAYSCECCENYTGNFSSLSCD